MSRMPTLKELVGPLLDSLETEAKAKGQKWSVRALELKHGIANGTLGQIAKGQRTTLNPDTTHKIALALGLSEAELNRAQRTSDDLDDAPDSGPERTPPAASTEIVREGYLAVLDEAFDGETHKPSDFVAVERLLRSRAAQILPGVDGPQIVRRWLDAAARIRERGENASSSAIIRELTARVVELEEANRRPVHPLVKQAQEKRRAREDR